MLDAHATSAVFSPIDAGEIVAMLGAEFDPGGAVVVDGPDDSTVVEMPAGVG